MAKQTINIGTSANDRTGDPLRTAFTKVNQNFTEVYNSIVTDLSDLTDNLNLLNANTGDITFDGIKIIGSGTASGDGLGYSTLELVPDNDLYANDQYIIIDPTAPNHIHIRAGGLQDNSSADFFLGGENTNIKISDGFETVTIGTSQVGENPISFSWTFDNNGKLSLPMGGALEPVGMGWTGLTNDDTGTPISIVNKTTNVDYIGQVISDITISGNSDTQGRISINTQDLVAPNTHSWVFDYDGSIIFPDNTVQITAWSGGSVVGEPNTSIGSSTDKLGDIAFDNSYLYYCTANYDGNTNIWKRVAWSNDTW